MILLLIPCPPLLDEISLKIFVSIRISNVMVNLKKASDMVFPSTRMHRLSDQFIGVIQIFRMLMLNDHVVHDQGGCHNVPKDFLIPKHSRSSHNSKLGSQNPECPLHIFPSSCLSIMELKFFLTLGAYNWLRKVGQFRYIPSAR